MVGGAGFVGSHLTERLLAEGHTVDVVDHLGTGSLANLADARQVAGALKIHTLDATSADFDTVVAMRAPEVVFHLAVLPPGQPAEQSAGAALSSVVATLEAARKVGGVKVVAAVSAVALYGDVAAKDQPIKEGHPYNPVGVRGVVSRAVIDLLGVYRDTHAVEFTALAMANLYGPRQRPEAGVVAAFAHAARHGTAAVIHGDGRQTRDFLYIDDAVDALVRAVTRGNGLVVNVGSGAGTSVRDLWDLVAGPAGEPPAAAPRRPDDVHRFVLAVSRARIQLGWAPWTDLATGLRAVLR